MKFDGSYKLLRVCINKKKIIWSVKLIIKCFQYIGRYVGIGIHYTVLLYVDMRACVLCIRT